MEIVFLFYWTSIMCSLSYFSYNTRSNQLRKSELEIVVFTCNFFLTKRIYQPCKTKAGINILEKNTSLINNFQIII